MSVLLEKVYNEYKVDSSLGVAIMCRNEKLRIGVTLSSIKNVANCIIIYDTGSTDNTIEIITEFCENNKINLYCIKGEFVDFSTSRNVMLEYAEKVPVQFILLLDVNDELKGDTELQKLITSECKSTFNGYRLKQNWVSNSAEPAGNEYYNTRLIKNNVGWRYHGVVHEYIHSHISNSTQLDQYDITLFQDRTKDDDKTGKRFHRDKQLLYNEFKKNPKDTRTLYYLGQTCACLGQHSDAFYYMKRRSELDDFIEEKFHAYMYLGNLSLHLGYNWNDRMVYYIKAYEISERVEPLVKIAEHYINTSCWHMAYLFIKKACQLSYPKCLLFVDKYHYTYTRWHLMGRTAYYVGEKADGMDACKKALEANPNSEIDKHNMKFYL